MAGTNTTIFANAMKTVYLGPIRDQIYSNKILFAGKRTRNGDESTNMPHGSRDFQGIVSSTEGINYMGNGFSLPLHTSRNSGVGARAESGFIPNAGAQGYHTMSDNILSFYGRVEFTGRAMKLSSSSKGAYVKVAASEMKGAADDLKRAINIDGYTTRDANGTSPRATISSTTASATQPVNTTLYLAVGDVVDVVSPGGSPTYRNASALTVVSVDTANKTVTLSASVSATANDLVILSSAGSTSTATNNTWGQSINGLGNIISDSGALHGLNPATAGQGFWKSYVHDASTGTISETMLRRCLDEIGIASGKDDSVIGIWTRGIRNAYANTLMSLKQFTDDKATTLRGGFKALLFDDRPFVVDDFCPSGTVFLANFEDMAWAEACPIEWADDDGNVLSRVPNKDSYEAYLRTFINLYTTRRNAHAKIINVADPMAR